jgi:hypothetical protein
MTRSRRPSAQTTAVVLALAEQPTAWRYGYELCQQLGLKPGWLYPILYRLTGSGRALATELAAARTAATATRRSGPKGSPNERWQGA